jgi:hypothetical protein
MNDSKPKFFQSKLDAYFVTFTDDQIKEMLITAATQTIGGLNAYPGLDQSYEPQVIKTSPGYTVVLVANMAPTTMVAGGLVGGLGPKP